MANLHIGTLKANIKLHVNIQKINFEQLMHEIFSMKPMILVAILYPKIKVAMNNLDITSNITKTILQLNFGSWIGIKPI